MGWGSLPPHPHVCTNKVKSLSLVILICFIFCKHTMCLSLNMTHRNLSRVSGTYSDVSFINLVEKGSHKRIFPIRETSPFNLHRLGWKPFLNAHTLSLPSSLNRDQRPCSPSRFLGVRIIYQHITGWDEPVFPLHIGCCQFVVDYKLRKQEKSKKLGPRVKCLSSMITTSVFYGFFSFLFFSFFHLCVHRSVFDHPERGVKFSLTPTSPPKPISWSSLGSLLTLRNATFSFPIKPPSKRAAFSCG